MQTLKWNQLARMNEQVVNTTSGDERELEWNESGDDLKNLGGAYFCIINLGQSGPSTFIEDVGAAVLFTDRMIVYGHLVKRHEEMVELGCPELYMSPSPAISTACVRHVRYFEPIAWAAFVPERPEARPGDASCQPLCGIL